MIKVALIDNMNNNFFSFARYLRNLNIDAHVYCLSNAQDHFKPEADTFVNIDTLHYIHYLPYVPSWKMQLNPFKPSLKELFSDFDIIIACGEIIAFLEQDGVKIDIVIPYGYDLYAYPFPDINIKSPIQALLRSIRANYQQKGLKNSRVMIMDEGYELYRIALERLNKNSYNYGVPMVYNKNISGTKEALKKWSFLDKHDFIVFNHSRQWWATQADDGLKDFDKYGGAKRNDKLIKAFAEFIKNSKFEAPLLILFTYGVDTEHSKELILKLRIEKFVKWMPTMNRKDILVGLAKSTFSSNSFRENLVDIGGVCYESFAVGVPHINNCKNALEDKLHKYYKSPMIHAISEDDILKIFIDYEKNPKKYNDIGEKSKTWFDEELGEGLARKYTKLIEILYNDKMITQEDIKLQEVLIDKK